MIKVTFYPTGSAAETHHAPTLADWFAGQFGPDMQLPEGLRVTCGSATRAADITDDLCAGDAKGHLTRLTGEYEVLEVPAAISPLVASILISAAITVVGILLAPTPPTVSTTNRRQESPSNALGNRSNEARPGERFPDVRGFEPAAYLDLLSEPYRRYEDNRENEYFYGAVSTGRVDFRTEPLDGITPLSSIPGAKFNAYGPNTSPNSGHAAIYVVGGDIGRPVVAADQSRNVNGQELPPPNAVGTANVKYRAYSDGTLEAIAPIPPELDFTQVYEVGQYVTLADIIAWEFYGTVSYTTPASPDPNVWPGYIKRDVSRTYTLIAVSKTSIQVAVLPSSDWQYFGAGQDLRTEASSTIYQGDTVFYLGDPEARPVPPINQVWTDETYDPRVLGVLDETVGPFRMPDGAISGWVNLVARNGLRKAAADNDYPLTLQFEFQIRELTSEGVPTGERTVLPIVEMTSNPLKITDQVGTTSDFNIPYFYSEILGRRLTDTDKEFQGTVIDEVQWDSLYTLDDLQGWSDPGDVTTAHVKIQQNPTALSVQERKVNFGIERYERRYLGNGQMSATADTPSDEFADAVVGLALDPTVGAGTTLDQIDVDSLYAVQEEIAQYFGTREAIKFGYVFDTTDLTFEEHLTLIGRSVFCNVYRIGNIYSFRFDRPRAEGETALLINHRMKYKGSDKRRRDFVNSRDNDGVIIRYKDIVTKTFETVTVPTGGIPTNPMEIEMPGVVYQRVAEWHAWRSWNRIQYRRRTHETKAFSMARGLVKGDRILMANDTSTAPQNGQVLEQNGLYLRLANGTDLTQPGQYSITLLYFSGTVENILCQPAPEIGPEWIQLFALPAEELYTGHYKWRTMYNLYLGTAQEEQDAMLVESVSVSIRNGREEIAVKAINYDVRYWQNDPQVVSNGSFSLAFNESFDIG